MGDLEWFLSAIVHLGHEDGGVWGVSPTTCMHLYSFTAACAVCVYVCVISGHTLPYICERVFISPPVKCGGCACTFTIWSEIMLFLEAHGGGGSNVIGCFSTQDMQKKPTTTHNYLVNSFQLKLKATTGGYC